MADFAPPPGPPPPKVPEGYKAVWNEQYKEWFFVNIYTKQSQWEKPTEPVYPSHDSAPPGAPPGYDHSTKPAYGGDEKGGLHSNNPYGAAGMGASGSSMSEDERLARQLQAEEDARRNGANRGTSDGYYGGAAGSSPYGQTGAPQYGQRPVYGQQEQKKSGGGLLGKLASKLGSGGSSRPHQSYGGGQPMYGHQQQYPMQGGYGGYPQQHGYGGYPQQGYPPRRTGGGGMGMAGGAALGAGAGLLGGAMLMNSFDNDEQEAYQDGYQDGQGDDFGGDDGGGDDGGGD